MASTLQTVLRQFGVSMASSAFKRQVEETLQPILERAITSGMDENATLREMALATRNIPGLRVASHAAVSAAGAVLSQHADELWLSDDRAFTRTMRAALKRLGPQLHFAADISADALEQAVKLKADGILSPATVAHADRKAELDQGVYLWPSEFPDRILIPARNDDGSIRYDQQGVPVILDHEVMARRFEEKYTRPTIRTVSSGKGQPSKQVTDPPQRPDFIGPFALRDAVQMVDMGRWDPAAAETIQRLLTPRPGHFASWGDDAWDVIRARNMTLARRSRETGHDWLANEESEGLARSLAEGQVDVTIVRELIGKAFKPHIGQNGVPAGELSFEDIDALEQVVFDHWCKGEQPKYTKIIRHARRIQRTVELRGVNPLGVMLAVAGITSLIWMPIVGMALVLLVATLMFVQGVFTPLTGGKVPFLGVAYDAKALAMASVFLAGWLAFAVTWSFPIYQTAMAWVRTLFPSLKEDWLVSLGRRIVAFGLLFCSGIEFYAVALNVAPIWRVVILAAASVGIAVAMGLAEAGYRYKAEEMVARAAKPTLFVFAIIPILLTFTVGVAQGNPKQTLKVGSWFSGLTAWHWMGLGILTLFALLVVSSFFGKSKEVKGEGDHAMTLASILGGFALIGVVCWLGLQGVKEIGSWFKDDPVQATTTVVTRPKDNGPEFDRVGMCEDPGTTYQQRKILQCP